MIDISILLTIDCSTDSKFNDCGVLQDSTVVLLYKDSRCSFKITTARYLGFWYGGLELCTKTSGVFFSPNICSYCEKFVSIPELIKYFRNFITSWEDTGSSINSINKFFDKWIEENSSI